MTTDEQRVRATWTAYGEALQALDLDGLQALWDQEYSDLLYQPEEYARPCRTWEEIVAYWTGIPAVVERIAEWRELETDVTVAGDLALCFSTLATSMHLHGIEEPLTGEVRFTAALRRSGGDWRLVHAHESRQLVVP
ncbi:nuclear transport factor 2 family protein [Nocardioides kongjuensis]|uniref:Ketosteroid isomerase-like protein n=1 Tax=Nocardioides kongjuensis TaxID=349522 RepID=A0A852RKF8_9ACTN|nr:nuclear transport factor 2 family protein [Nocardioides kongjuensis]NYD31099.1 ketosteroid isomerase-like protein [Nocardioides kongjuensis]